MNTKRTKQPISWGAVSAFCCFSGGLVAALIGSILTAGTWIWGAAPHPLMRGIGTTLLILTIPLLILAGHCMDWMEREQKQSRRELHGHSEHRSDPV